MYRRLLKDASLYSVSAIVARGFSFITVPIYTRILSPADYGALDLLSYLALLVPLLVSMALDQAVARFFSDATDRAERRRIASTVLLYNILIFALFIPIALPLANWLAREWLGGQVTQETVLLAFGFTWVNAVFYIATNQLKYQSQSSQFAFCSIGYAIVSVVLTFIFIVYFRLGVFGVFLGQVLAAGAFAVLAIYLGRESYGLMFDWRTLKRLLTYSLPLVPGTLTFYLMQYVDRLTLNELSGLEDVGLYGIGARLASVVNLFLTGFQGAWAPVVFRSFRERGAPERFARVFRYYLFAVSAILIALSFYSKEILLLLTTESFSRSYGVVPLLLLSAILASVAQYFTYGIEIAKKTRYRMALNVAALMASVILNLALVPRFGIFGAALAGVLSFALLTVIAMTLSQKQYYVPYDWTRISAAVVLVVAASCLMIPFGGHVSWAFFIIKFGVALVALYMLARLLGINLTRKAMAILSAGTAQPR